MKKPHKRKEPVQYNPHPLFWKTTQFGRYVTFCRNKFHAKLRKQFALQLQGETACTGIIEY